MRSGARRIIIGWLRNRSWSGLFVDESSQTNTAAEIPALDEALARHPRNLILAFNVATLFVFDLDSEALRANGKL